MPEAPRVPTIPTVMKDDLDNRYEALIAIKMAVEMMQGQRGGIPVARTFVQEDTPQAMNVGDFWVQPSKQHVSCWGGANWIALKGAP
jgi:hypothetical protein